MDPFGTLLNLIIVFGPIVGFIPQYNEIKKSRDSNAFSTLICFILLVSNTLRIFFWFGKRFDYSLLFQSIVMIVAQLLLLELIVRIKKSQNVSSTNKKGIQIPSIDRSYINNFWNWANFEDYLSFLIFLAGILTIFTIFNGLYFHSMLMFEFIGSMSLIIESTLGMPQLYRNWINKSSKGLRFELILSWFAGDIFKTIFFIAKRSPVQFVACGLVQIIVDLAIMSQMMYYNDGLLSSPLKASFLPQSMNQKPLSSTSKHSDQIQHQSHHYQHQSSYSMASRNPSSSSSKNSPTNSRKMTASDGIGIGEGESTTIFTR